jgi:hypothetical protein
MKKILRLSYALVLFHFCILSLILFLHSEIKGSSATLSIIDFPAYVPFWFLIRPIIWRLDAPIIWVWSYFVIAGSAWWYFLGWCVEEVLSKIKSRNKYVGDGTLSIS